MPPGIGRPRTARDPLAALITFAECSVEEAELELLREDLAVAIRRARAEAGLTQAQLAQRLGTSQSRIAKLERPEPGTNITRQLKALFALGLRRNSIHPRHPPLADLL